MTITVTATLGKVKMAPGILKMVLTVVLNTVTWSLSARCYQIMRKLLHMSDDEMSEIFWNGIRAELSISYPKITGKILAFKDTDGTPIVEENFHTADVKGTGKWGPISALEEGSCILDR